MCVTALVSHLSIVFAVCDILLRQLFMDQKPSPSPYIPVWRQKSRAARQLKISRKTIQRKVRLGLLAEDSSGRVCVARLAALLTAEAKCGRRGPKLRLPKKLRPIYEFRSPAGFHRVSEHDDPADRLAGAVDDNAVDEICERIVGLNLATLREISEVALTVAGYQARYARLEMRATPDELREALRRARTTAR